MKFCKRATTLALCMLLIISMMSVTAFAASSYTSAQVVGIINKYTASAYLYVTETSYNAYTSYGATADTIKVSATITQRNATTGQSMVSRSNSNTSDSDSYVSITGTTGSNVVFYSGTSSHVVDTFSDYWSVSLGTVYA